MPEILRVILNDRPLGAALTGVGFYTQQILHGIPPVDPGVQIDPFVARYVRRAARTALPECPADPPARPAAHRRKPPWLCRLLDRGQEIYFRRRVAQAGRYHVYHEPNHLPMPCDLPTVTTVHDLSVLEHPDWHPAARVRLFERRLEAGLRRSARLIAVSEFTKARLVAHFGLAPDVITVTYQAARAAFQPQSAEDVRTVRAKLGLPERFFLFVGTLEPRKNIPVLLEAYFGLPAALRRERPLVLVGPWGWLSPPLRAQVERAVNTTEVRRLGYVDDHALACLYSASTAFVWPSLYEGFGLPPLEAMACGAPVIVSDVSALPEVVGAGGLHLDPRNGPAWTAAMERMAVDEPWRKAWLLRGLARAAEFSWERCCRATAACYRTAGA